MNMKKGMAVAALILLHQVCLGHSEPKTSRVPEWENLGEIDMVPCPKQIAVLDEWIPIDQGLVLVKGMGGCSMTTAAAGDLAKIIREKTSIEVEVVTEDRIPAGANAVLLGVPGESGQIQRLCDQKSRNVGGMESQGYRIFHVVEDGLYRLVVAGVDPQGVYWGAMTLADLIEGSALRIAEVVDWPDFKWREVDVMTDIMGMYTRTGDMQGVLEVARERIRYAARFKCNLLRTGNIIQVDPVTDYYTDDRADFLRQIGEYALDRGMRLFINIRSSTGVIGRDEERFPQLRDAVREKHYYYTWSDDEVIDYACSRITEMVRKIGPHVYFFHAPDIPNIGWERRSQSDRERWGDDRIAAETHVMNRMYHALIEGDPSARMIYLYKPYHPTGFFHGGGSGELRAMLDRYEGKLNPEIGIAWREHSVETAQQLRDVQGNRPIDYYIENNAWHFNRLAGGVSRTYKSYYFEANDEDLIRSNINLMGRFTHHLPFLGIHAEYGWNTHAPDSLYVHTDPEALEEGQRDHATFILENGMDYWTWLYGPDLEGAVSDELLPRVCHKIFGTDAGRAMAVAYSSGGTIHRDHLGGTAFSSPLARYRNSSRSARLNLLAFEKLRPFWGHPERFEQGLFDTYSIYQSVFKYVCVYRHIERINAYVQRIHHIGQTGEDAGLLDAVYAEAVAAIEQARAQLAMEYEEYGLDRIPFDAIYRQDIGDLESVNGQMDRLAAEIEFRMGVIRQFGAGEDAAPKRQAVIGIAPVSDPIHVDGNLKEWDVTNPLILDSSSLVPWVDASGFSGDLDQVSYWFFRHDDDFLYGAALVYDDDIVFTHDSALHRNDSVELWLNGDQVVISKDSSGKTRVETYLYGGAGLRADDIRAVVSTGEGIYPFHPERPWWLAEFRIPLASVERDLVEGEVTFAFAFGANDADSSERGVAQFYYPDSYVHLRRPGASIDDFAKAILSREDSVGIAVDVTQFELHQMILADGTYTCFDLDFSMEAQRSVPGARAEVRMHTDKGIRRFDIQLPPRLDRWALSSPLEVNTREYYHELAALHVELIIQTPWEEKVIVLQEGRYKDRSVPFIGRDLVDVQIAPALEPSREVLFYASFDDETLFGTGTAPLVPVDSAGISFVEGKRGKAVRIDEGGYIQYEQSSIPPEGAVISFWFKPLFRPEDHVRRTVLKMFDDFNRNRIFLFNNANFSYAFSIKGETEGTTLSFRPHEVHLDRWNHFEISWNTKKSTVSFMLNGNIRTEEIDLDITDLSRFVWVGASNSRGANSAPCLIDELMIKRID